jgi:hypothetical protein
MNGRHCDHTCSCESGTVSIGLDAAKGKYSKHAYVIDIHISLAVGPEPAGLLRPAVTTELSCPDEATHSEMPAKSEIANKNAVAKRWSTERRPPTHSAAY